MLRPRHLDRNTNLDLAENAAPVLNVVEKSRCVYMFKQTFQRFSPVGKKSAFRDHVKN
jgi:hypothetical protein